MSEKEKPFTVNDRRHFTPEGRAREESPGPPAPGRALPRPPRRQRRSRSPPSVDAASPSAGESSAAGPRRRVADAGAPVEFGSSCCLWGRRRACCSEPSGAAEGEADALEGARQIISILEMLQGKTEGRRTADESRILEELLFQLRMALRGPGQARMSGLFSRCCWQGPRWRLLPRGRRRRRRRRAGRSRSCSRPWVGPKRAAIPMRRAGRSRTSGGRASSATSTATTRWASGSCARGVERLDRRSATRPRRPSARRSPSRPGCRTAHFGLATALLRKGPLGVLPSINATVAGIDGVPGDRRAAR